MKKTIFALTLLLLATPLFLCAQEVNFWERKYYFATQHLAAAERTLNVMEGRIPPEQVAQEVGRTRVVEEALRNVAIELAFEYAFSVKGDQIFEIVDSDGMRVSRLHYPHRGQMYIYKGEVRFFDKIGVGGRYGSSDFRRTTCTDTDWVITPDFVWWESNSTTKAKVSLYDINLYYRLLDLTTEDSKGTRDLFDTLRLEKNARLTLDAFVGYLEQKGRYGVTDLVDTMEWWTPVNFAYEGQDSFYKVKYSGPRFGLRTEGASGKIATSISFAYALLKTKGYGWWNLRELTFEQNGDNGYGLDFGFNATYNVTSQLALGMGINYTVYRQSKARESRNLPGYTHDELDVIRNIESIMCSPTLFLRYRW